MHSHPYRGIRLQANGSFLWLLILKFFSMIQKRIMLVPCVVLVQRLTPVSQIALTVLRGADLTSTLGDAHSHAPDVDVDMAVSPDMTMPPVITVQPWKWMLAVSPSKAGAGGRPC